MPVAPTYTGVYVEEVPSGVHPIAGVPTAIGAFIGSFPKGVMNTAVEVLSFADVEREFGGLSAQSDTSFALSQLFLNGGARAWVVRVAALGDGGDALDAAAIDVPADGGGTAFTLTATSEGAWGRNLRAQVLGPDADHRFDLTVSVVGQSGGRPAVLQQETFGGLTCASVDDANYVTTAVNGVSQLVVVSGAGTTDPVPTGLVSGTGVTGLAAAADRQIDVKVGTAGAITVRLPATAVTTLEELAAVVQSAIRGANGADPVWAGVVAHPLPGSGSLQRGATRRGRDRRQRGRRDRHARAREHRLHAALPAERRQPAGRRLRRPARRERVRRHRRQRDRVPPYQAGAAAARPAAARPGDRRRHTGRAARVARRQQRDPRRVQRAVLPAGHGHRSDVQQPAALARPGRNDRRPDGADRRLARRVEGAGRHRGDAARAHADRRRSHRSAERPAQPDRGSSGRCSSRIEAGRGLLIGTPANLWLDFGVLVAAVVAGGTAAAALLPRLAR